MESANGGAYMETAMTGDTAVTALAVAAPAAPTGGGMGNNVLGHAKGLAVNKMGHTMVPPPDPTGVPGRYRRLFWQNRLKTITYCLVFWCFGMCVAFLGPMLLDLQCRIASVFSTMSWVFFSQSLFTLVGSACGGALVQTFGNHVVLFISTSMLSLTLAFIPFCKVLWRLASVLATMGFFMGTIDTVANISMIQLYGRNVAPFLQALHFFYGLGAFLAPIIAEPFLINKDCSQMIQNSTHTHHPIDLSNPNASQPVQEIMEVQHESKIQYAFWILSGLQGPVVVMLATLMVREKMGWGQQETDTEVEAGKDTIEMQNIQNLAAAGKDEDRPPVTKEQILYVTILTAIMLFLYDGLQAGYGAYVFSYAVKSIAGMSMNEAARLNACFWGTFAFGRLMSIGISTRIAPNFMLLCNISGCLVAMVLMLAFRHNHGVLYLGTCIFGTFLSSVYPTAVTLAEQYINVTSHITSLLVVLAASGEMLIPVIIGHEFAAFGPASLLVSGVIMTVISFVIYVLLFLVSQNITRQSSDRTFSERLKNVFMKARGQPDVSDEDTGLMKHHVKYYTRMRSDLSEEELADENAMTTGGLNGSVVQPGQNGEPTHL